VVGSCVVKVINDGSIDFIFSAVVGFCCCCLSSIAVPNYVNTQKRCTSETDN